MNEHKEHLHAYTRKDPGKHLEAMCGSSSGFFAQLGESVNCTKCKQLLKEEKLLRLIRGQNDY